MSMWKYYHMILAAKSGFTQKAQRQEVLLAPFCVTASIQQPCDIPGPWTTEEVFLTTALPIWKLSKHAIHSDFSMATQKLCCCKRTLLALFCLDLLLTFSVALPINHPPAPCFWLLWLGTHKIWPMIYVELLQKLWSIIIHSQSDFRNTK